MTHDQIRAKMQEASDQFNELKAQADAIEVKLQQLQGKYAAWQEMLDEPDPALTVAATPAKSKK